MVLLSLMSTPAVPGTGTKVLGSWLIGGSVYDFLTRLEDRRDPRGVRYSLVRVLDCVMLAKLFGQQRLAGIAEWVRYRKEALPQALGLRHPQAPHRITDYDFQDRADCGSQTTRREQAPPFQAGYLISRSSRCLHTDLT